MALTKEKKQTIVKDLDQLIDQATTLVFVNFHGLTVAEANELRVKLEDKGVNYLVTKKTLLKRVLGEKQLEGQLPNLEGECALAYGDDLIAPAREIYEFHKSYPDTLSILGGVFDGRYMNKEEMEEVASIPSHQVLLGQFVNLINSPIQQLVTGLSRVAEKRAA